VKKANKPQDGKLIKSKNPSPVDRGFQGRIKDGKMFFTLRKYSYYGMFLLVSVHG